MRSRSASTGPFFTAAYSVRRSAHGQHAGAAPLTCSQLMAWTTGGMSSQRLNRLAHEHGIAFRLDSIAATSLQTAGVEPACFIDLPHADASVRDAGCPALLVRAGQLIQHKKYHPANRSCRNGVRRTPTTRPCILPWVLFNSSRTTGMTPQTPTKIRLRSCPASLIFTAAWRICFTAPMMRQRHCRGAHRP